MVTRARSSRIRGLGLALAAPFVPVVSLHAQLDAYWLDGRAEVCRYELEIRRDGELRKGYALLLFSGGAGGARRPRPAVGHEVAPPAGNVLELRRIERFTVGLADESCMATTTTLLDLDGKDLPRTLATTTSVQSWGGQTWRQTRRRDDALEVVMHDLAEPEANARVSLAPALLEDEVLTQIRLGPHRLPLGEVAVIPSAARALAESWNPAVVTAKVSRSEVPRSPTDDVPQDEYRLEFDEGGGNLRTLAVRFNKGYPFHITRYEETLRHGDETTLLRRAVLQRALKVDVGAHRAGQDDALRTEFGLGPVK